MPSVLAMLSTSESRTTLPPGERPLPRSVFMTAVKVNAAMIVQKKARHVSLCGQCEHTW